MKASFTAFARHPTRQGDLAEQSPLQITARPGQMLTVCSHRVTADETGTRSALFVQGKLSKLVITDWQTALTLDSPFPCPDDEAKSQPYHFRNVLRSDEPFMVVVGEPSKKRQKPSSFNSDQQGSPIMGMPSTLSAPAGLLSGSGYGSDSDETHFPKRPPHLPLMDKSDLSLTLLPFIRLPAEWWTQLPGWQWFHWLVGEPDAEAGVTIMIRLNQSNPVALHLSPWEYRELAENMQGTHQLLQWLAYKLSGRETFIQTLLDRVALMDEQEVLDETLAEKLEEQLMIVLEQPDREFSLEFELHQLAESLSGSALAQAESSIVHLPTGKTGEQPQLPAGQGSEQSSEKEKTSKDLPERPAGQNQRGNGEGSKPPSQPTPAQARGAGEQVLADYFVIVVNGVEFRIKKEQLPPLERGQKKASLVKAYRPENPAESLPLSEIESVAGIREQGRLSKYDNKPLDYLLAYGTEATKNALQHYFPVSLISEHGGHLVAETDHRGYPVDETCQICKELLLAQHSLTACTQSSQHIFHTGCLSRALRTRSLDAFTRPGQGEFSHAQCPVCRAVQSSTLTQVFSKEGLISELHRSAKAGESAIIKALLESHVNVEARDEQGNTALHLAAQAGHSDIVLLLTDFGANFEAENHAGQQPITIAAEHPDIIDIIKQANENPNIFFTVLTGNEEALRQWLDEWKDLEVTRPFDGASLLHLAAHNDHADSARHLLDRAKSLGSNLVNMVDSGESTPLHEASSSGSLNVAMLLLGSGAEVDCDNNAQHTALMYTAKEGHTEIADQLIRHGAKIDFVSGCHTALMHAVQNGHVAITELLVSHGADVNKINMQYSPLMLAAQNGHPEVAKVLLRYGANVNYLPSKGFSVSTMGEKDLHKLKGLGRNNPVLMDTDSFTMRKTGFTPLMEAALNGHPEVAKALLNHGADINQAREDGDTALSLAISSGHPQMVELLVSSGANLAWGKEEDGNNILALAVIEGHADIVKVLLNLGVDTQNGWHLLEVVARGYSDVTKILLAHGYPYTVALSTKEGEPLLMLAASKGHVDTVNTLIDYGAELDTPMLGAATLLQALAVFDAQTYEDTLSRAGQTALMLAAMNGHSSAVKTLLKRQANANARTILHGYTALMYAASDGQLEVVKLLVDFGADLNPENSANTHAKSGEDIGETALTLAAQNSHYEVAEFLKSRGARVSKADKLRLSEWLFTASVSGKYKAVKALIVAGADIHATDEFGFTPLISASQEGQAAVVKELLDRGALTETRNNQGITSLGMAAYKGHHEVVKVLLDAGANTDVPHVKGNTALHFAAQNDHPETAKVLLSYNAKVEIKNSQGLTVLEMAVYKGHHKIIKTLLDANVYDDDHIGSVLCKAAGKGYYQGVKALLAHNASVNYATPDGLTPLMQAIQQNHTEVTTILLEAGARVDVADNTNSVPALYLAALNGNSEIVKLLLEKGAAVDQVKTPGRFTALGAAAVKGHLNVASILLQNGASVDHASNNRATPLLLSAEQGQPEIAKLLLQHGADLHLSLPDGRTALMVAVKKGHSEVVSVLLNAGADADAVDSESGAPMLYLAALNGNSEIVKLLLENGAAVDQVKTPGRITALGAAAVKGHVDVASILLKNKAAVDHVARNGSTPLLLSAEQGQSEVVELLLQWGADVDFSLPDGCTALILAAQENHPEVVRILLRKGADASATNAEGETAYTLASKKGHSEIVKLLQNPKAVQHPSATVYGSEQTPLLLQSNPQSNRLPSIISFLRSCSCCGGNPED